MSLAVQIRYRRDQVKTAMATSAAVARPRTKPAPRFGGDQLAWLVTFLFALSILAVTVLLVFQLWVHSSPAREKFGFGFLTSQIWNPVTNEFGALPFIYGTAITSLLALLISVPLGVGAAIYLSELAGPGLSTTLTFLVELLAAVPSVIFGLLAIFTLVPMMRNYIGPALRSSWVPRRCSAARSMAWVISPRESFSQS